MGLDEEIEEFLLKACVDDKAAAALRGEDDQTKQAVLDRGEMSECRNPSASLITRIRQAKENNRERNRSRSRSAGRGNSSSGGNGLAPSTVELEDFVRDNNVDQRAAAQLMEADPMVQKNVLERGSLTDCRNPSAVCLARIRDAKASRAQPTIQQLAPMMYGAYGYPGQMYGGHAYSGYVAYGTYPGYAGYSGYPAYQQAYVQPQPHQQQSGRQ